MIYIFTPTFVVDNKNNFLYDSSYFSSRTIMKGKQKLGDRELDIMQVLWQKGKATVSEVQQELLDQGSQVAYTTIQTMLNRLEAKGFVVRDNTDRAHSYRSVLKEPAAVNSAVERLIERFFSGSAEALVTRLVEKELSIEQLERLQALISTHREKETKK
jgi:BlaI family transcriptional regulator, penicillinase repressor